MRATQIRNRVFESPAQHVSKEEATGERGALVCGRLVFLLRCTGHLQHALRQTELKRERTARSSRLPTQLRALFV
jgi:hypothetical protein